MKWIIMVVDNLPAKKSLIKVWYETRVKGYELKILINKKLYKELCKRL